MFENPAPAVKTSWKLNIIRFVRFRVNQSHTNSNISQWENQCSPNLKDWNVKSSNQINWLFDIHFLLLSRKQDILACLEEGTEGCLTLVGPARIEKTVSAFVRLANSIVMNNTIEVRNEDYFIDLSYTI